MDANKGQGKIGQATGARRKRKRMYPTREKMIVTRNGERIEIIGEPDQHGRRTVVVDGLPADAVVTYEKL